MTIAEIWGMDANGSALRALGEHLIGEVAAKSRRNSGATALKWRDDGFASLPRSDTGTRRGMH
jgi:hypothetical protein